MYSAFRGGSTTKHRLQDIYLAARDPERSHNVIRDRICGTGRVFDRDDPHSPEPLPGDLVFFGEGVDHAAISLGAKTRDGAHEVMSLWAFPVESNERVMKTTVEELGDWFHDARVYFYAPNWR